MMFLSPNSLQRYNKKNIVFYKVVAGRTGNKSALPAILVL